MAFYKSNYFLARMFILFIFIYKINGSDVSMIKNNIYPHNRRLTETYSNDKLDGLVKLYHANGQVEWRYTFYKGIQHGLITRWNSSGLMLMEGCFNNGDSSGVWKWYGDTGKTIKEKDFSNNLYFNNSNKKRYIMKIKNI
jgi:antitoxin component YwqK of YwqJK toxin-antitoxin module